MDPLLRVACPAQVELAFKGRLLITFLLCNWNILDRPLLYLSYFFKSH